EAPCAAPAFCQLHTRGLQSSSARSGRRRADEERGRGGGLIGFRTLGVHPPHFPRLVIERRIPMRYGRLMAMGIVFAGLLFAPTALAQQKTNQPQKWEYKIVNTCNPNDRGTDIQQLGEEGWELVATDIVAENQCGIRYFKRPKIAESKQVVKRPPQQPAAPQCSVPLDKAPTIRGLHLGMSVDELLSLFAANNNLKSRVETVLKEAGPAPNYGLATFGIDFYSGVSKEAQVKFAGINSFGFKKFDGRVVEINMNNKMYNQRPYPQCTMDEWTAKVANTYSLPGANNWESSPRNDQRKLKCKELEVEAAIYLGPLPPLPGIGRYQTPRLTITDPSYRKVIEQRAKSDQEMKQRECVFYPKKAHHFSQESQSRAIRHNEEANKLQQRGLIAEAVKYYEKATKLWPAWATPWYNLGLLRKEQRNWRESLRCNQKAVTL